MTCRRWVLAVLISLSAESLLGEEMPVKSWNYVEAPATGKNTCSVQNSQLELIQALKGSGWNPVGAMLPRFDWQTGTIVLITTADRYATPKSNIPSPDGTRVDFLFVADTRQVNSGVFLFELAGKHPGLQGCSVQYRSMAEIATSSQSTSSQSKTRSATRTRTH